MLRRIEIHRHAAVQTLLNRIFQYGDPMLFFLQQPQTRPNHLAGVFVPSLCDLVLYESLEVASRETDVFLLIIPDVCSKLPIIGINANSERLFYLTLTNLSLTIMIQAVFFPLIRLVVGLVSYQLFKSVAFALRGIPNSSYISCNSDLILATGMAFCRGSVSWMSSTIR